MRSAEKATTLKIGQLARRARVAVDTVRFYERRGLLDQPARSPAGYRLYDREALRRVQFVKRAQALGFTLAEIRELLELSAHGDADCAALEPLARAKVAEIDAKLHDLDRMRAALEELAARCPGSGPIADCPILDALQPEDDAARQAPQREEGR